MIRVLLNIYSALIFVDAILSFFPQFSQQEWRKKIKKLADYSLDPVRRKLPDHLPFDFSPLIVVTLIHLFILLF
jgi:YggT family protein